MNDLSLKMLAGDSIEIENVGTLSPITIREIKDIGEKEYNQYLSIALLDKNSIELSKDVEVSNFDLLYTYSIYDNDFWNLAKMSIAFFFKEEPFLSEDGFIYFAENRTINNLNFDYIQKVIRLQNCIKEEKEEEYNPANEQARKLIEMIKKNKKNKPKVKSNINIHSIVSGIAWKSNTINILNIWDLTVYQLYDAYARLENIDYIHNTLSGIYAGTIDSKNIDMSKLTWAKILEN